MSNASANAPKGAVDDLQIGEWRLAARGNELRRGDEVVHLEPKAAEVLAYLGRRPGEVVGREELLAAVWPGVVVGDDALTQAIIKLRKALGDNAHAARYIETVSKRGYRLIATVSEATSAKPVAAAAGRPASKRRRAYVAAATVIALVGLAALLAGPRIPWPLASLSPSSPGEASIPTVAIMPLSNLSADPHREYFSDGMTEDLISALGRFTGIRVMSRNAVMGFKGKSPSPHEIRDQLGARYIVRGSVREADGKLRVAVELSDADKGALLASETYDGEGGQLFELQDRMVRNIVGKLHVKLSRIEEQRMRGRPTESLEAHDLVLQARALLDRTDRSANREARALLARARQLAPDYAEIHTTMGASEFQRVTDGFVENAAEALRRAEDHLKRALASPDLRAHARAHSHLAAIYSHQNRADEALVQAKRAIELNPSDSHALYWQGAALLFVGRIDEAIKVLEMARRFDPYPSVGRGLNLALAYYVAGRYNEALAQADALLARSPRNGFLHAMRAATLAQMGRDDESRQAAEHVRRFNPVFDAENFGSRFADPKYTATVRDGLRRAGL